MSELYIDGYLVKNNEHSKNMYNLYLFSLFNAGKKVDFIDNLEGIKECIKLYNNIKSYTISELINLPHIWEEPLSMDSAIDVLDIYEKLNTVIKPEYEQLKNNIHFFSELYLAVIADNKEFNIRLYILYDKTFNCPVALIMQTLENIDIRVLDKFWLSNFLSKGFEIIKTGIIKSEFDVFYEEELNKSYKLLSEDYDIEEIIG